MSVNDPGDGRDGDVPGSSDQNAGPPLDVDTAFAAIVAGWSDEPSDQAGPWPAQENLSKPERQPGTDAKDADDDGPDDDQLVAATSSPALPSLEIGPSQTERDLDEGYVPPEPPPIPRGDFVGRLAWAGVLGGPLLLLLLAMIWRAAPQLLVLGAVGAFVAGFVTLVARMPQHHDDDGDDGAVV